MKSADDETDTRRGEAQRRTSRPGGGGFHFRDEVEIDAPLERAVGIGKEGHSAVPNADRFAGKIVAPFTRKRTYRRSRRTGKEWCLHQQVAKLSRDSARGSV